MNWRPDSPTRVSCLNDINIYGTDVKTICPGKWLNDNAITFCLEFILSGLEATRRNKVHVVHASMCEVVKAIKDHQILKSFFEDVNLREMKLVLFIVNDNADPSVVLGGTHWTLLVWEQSLNRFLFYDSLNSAHQSLMVARQIAISMYSLLADSDCQYSFICCNCPRQKNSSDCGMHVIETARIILEKDVEAVQSNRFPSDMQTQRIKWIELLHHLSKSE